MTSLTRWRPAVPLAYLALAVALTWPTVLTFTTRIGGDGGDGFQSLWSFWWIKESLLHLHSPFFTDHLRAPFGVTLVFSTSVIPDALVALPLWSVLPPLGVYNAALLWSFTLTGWGMYALMADWTGSRPAAFFCGAAFMATPFHVAHALGHQQLVSLGYLPLYLLFLHRIVRGGTIRDAVLGGLVLALAALCSWYQLMFAFGWSLGVFGYAAIAHRKTLLTVAFAKRALALAAAFLLVCGPLIAAMYRAAHQEPIAGSHEASDFSADLESFFFPNERSLWADLSTRWRHWTGNGAENGDYLGYGLLILAAIGAAESTLARAYLITGTIAALISLGPRLHIAGVTSHAGVMPYAKLVQIFPGLEFSGVPVRFGLMTQGSLVIAAGLGVRRLVGALPATTSRGAATLALTALILTELWPKPLPTTTFSVPPPMLEWASSAEDFSLLDKTGNSRSLWNAIHHGKRCINGYVTRVPKRLDDWLTKHPVLSKIGQDPKEMNLRLTREDPAIDFDWGEGSPGPDVFSDLFHATWDGNLEVPSEDDYRFLLSADDEARAQVDERLVAVVHESQPSLPSTIHLTAGVHPLHVEYDERWGTARIRLEWVGTNLPRQLLVPAAGTAFHASYADARVESGLSREVAVKMLEDLHLRYIALSGRDAFLERDLGLPSIWSDGDIYIYEVPK